MNNAHNGHDNNPAQYTLTDDMSHTNFFPAFDFYSSADPTKGFVQYQNQTAAVEKNLVRYMPDTQSNFMGVDYTTRDPAGRASVRLESKKSWNQGLLIADILHMPSSQCGNFPAFWLLSSSAEWPMGGEIDILEGVNDYEANSVTLHTSTGCTVDNATTHFGGGFGAVNDFSVPFSGTMATDDCDVDAQGQGKNVGCSIHAPTTLSGIATGAFDNAYEMHLPSYGTNFNRAGGGIYAMEWTSEYISVWFFPRYSPSFTRFFGLGATTPDPSAWGTPLARFSGRGCDYTQRFKDLRIIFNTAFCGEWAGREWEEKGCARKTGVDSCDDYVRDNPQAFTEAYWEIAGLKWFQKGVAKVKRGTVAPSFVKAKGRFFGW
jgi:nicotinate-nucleotide pyrophosphorylase (carboxylating)